MTPAELAELNERIAALEDENAELKTPRLARNQPCGCVICQCDDPVKRHGCGAKDCKTHIGAEIPNPVYEAHPLMAQVAALTTERDGLAAKVIKCLDFIDTVKDTSDDMGEDASDFLNAIAAEFTEDILAARDERMKRQGAVEALNQLIGAMVESDHVSLEYIQYRLAALVEEVGRG